MTAMLTGENEGKRFRLLEADPWLAPYEGFFLDLHRRAREKEAQLTRGRIPLKDFARAHEWFGVHYRGDQWVLREWAPNARRMYLIGTFSGWQRREEFAFERLEHGQWELRLPSDALHHGDLYRLFLEWSGGSGERIPAYARRVVQDESTKIFSGQIWRPDPYRWRVEEFRRREGPLFIYEAHVGMAQEHERVGWYHEFRTEILPRIVKAGYSAVQLMAIQEHPYYGSFGYQVSSFFAPSSRFGTPEELKELIDAAHEAGLAVYLDVVHSHAVRNEVEGLSRLDGTTYQYFHEGANGYHPLWDSRLFNYGKTEVLHFLLSNVRYWIEEFKFDGFRFDGVTSMLYYDHGLKSGFDNYDRYFGPNLDRDALVYLMLANRVAHAFPGVETTAEDVSGLPGLAAPEADGGFGFDYRLAMGIPDFWIKILKTRRDHEWPVDAMFGELTNRRADEKTISYAESHDQALVGDKTLIFRLLDAEMYWKMRIDQSSLTIDRGLALHRLIRFITAATAANGYLNFMGNEFGHPEWIDFPRAGNHWSYKYARRQWHLVDDPALQYCRLGEFDRRMLELIRTYDLYRYPWPYKHYEHVANQVLLFSRGPLYFIFNFNPSESFPSYALALPRGRYRPVFDTDGWEFGGHGRAAREVTYESRPKDGGSSDYGELQIYLPTRTAIVLIKES